MAVRLPAEADCVISMEYNSELLNYVSKNGKSWHGENLPILIQIERAKLPVYFVVQGLPNFLTRDLVALNKTVDIT